MKAKLIIANWLISFVLLSGVTDSLIIKFLMVAYFGVSCYFLRRNYVAVYRRLYRMNIWIDGIINKI